MISNKKYFIPTIDNILNKTTKQYEQKIEKCNQTLYNQSIKAAWMDKTTAIYNYDYVCEYYPERSNNLNYLGFDIDEYIDLTLKKWGVNNNEFSLSDLIGLMIILIIILFVLYLITQV